MGTRPPHHPRTPTRAPRAAVTAAVLVGLLPPGLAAATATATATAATTATATTTATAAAAGARSATSPLAAVPAGASGLASRHVGGMTVRWSRTLASGVSDVPAVDGTQVLVPTRSGSLVSLDTGDGHTRFATPAGGAPLTAPRMDAGRVYVAARDCRVAAYSKWGGAVVWRTSVASWCREDRAGVAVHGNRIAVPTPGGTVQILDADDGHVRAGVRGAWAPSRTAPTTSGPYAYTTWDDGSVTAVRVAQGTRAFRVRVGTYARATPAVADGRVLVGDDRGILHALDAGNGRVRWTRSLADAATWPLSRATPLVVGDTVFTTVGERAGYHGAVVALDASNGRIRWRTPTGYTEDGVAVSSGVVYAVSTDGRISALDAADGTLLSQTDRVLSGAPVGSPRIDGTTVVVATSSGQVLALSTVGRWRGPGSSPSGVSVPRGDLTHWRQVLADDFTGTLLDGSTWTTYNGTPRAYPGTHWRSANVGVGGGLLTLSSRRDPGTGQLVTGGVSSARGVTQRYGRYEVRLRSEKSDGVGIVALLWPSAGAGWPPEIDFVEDGGGSRSHPYATLHYGKDDRQIHRSTQVDMTRWHTYGVEWSPGSIVYTLDGQPFADITGWQVPSVPMELDIQAHTDHCSTNPQCAARWRTVDTEIDWVTIYEHR